MGLALASALPSALKRARLEIETELRQTKEFLENLIQSSVDAIVAVENAARIYRAARHPKSFVSLDDADHLLTRERDARSCIEFVNS